MLKAHKDPVRKVFLLILLVSFGTTAHGLTSVIKTDNIWTTYGAAVAGSLLLQVFIVGAWGGFGKMVGDGYRYLPLGFAAIGLVASISSAVFASSTNVEVLNMNFLVQEQANENRAFLTKPVGELAKFTGELSQQIDAYAELAGQRSKIEAEAGASCEGLPKPPVCGSLCNLRNQQKIDASENAKLSRALNEKALQLQASAVGTQTQEQVNKLFLDVNRLKNGGEIAKIRTWVAGEERGFRDGFTFRGKVLQCKDPQASDMIASIQTLASKTIDFPAEPPRVTEQGVSDAAVRNIHALGTLVVTALSAPSKLGTFIASPSVSPFVFPWVVAFMIELVCAAFAIVEGYQRRGAFGEPTGRPLDPAAKLRQQQILWAIRRLSVHEFVGGRKHTWLVVPIDATQLPFDVENLPHFLRLTQPVMRGPIEINQVIGNEAIRSRIQEAAGNAKLFTLWNFKNYDSKVAEIARQLGLDPITFEPSHNPGGASSTSASLRLIR